MTALYGWLFFVFVLLPLAGFWIVVNHGRALRIRVMRAAYDPAVLDVLAERRGGEGE